MALVPLSAEELAETPTLFASFMGDIGTGYKTLGQLREIYRERSKALSAAEDGADDLRVERFIEDMASKRWSSSVVMRIGVFDGTTARDRRDPSRHRLPVVHRAGDRPRAAAPAARRALIHLRAAARCASSADPRAPVAEHRPRVPNDLRATPARSYNHSPLRKAWDLNLRGS